MKTLLLTLALWGGAVAASDGDLLVHQIGQGSRLEVLRALVVSPDTEDGTAQAGVFSRPTPVDEEVDGEIFSSYRVYGCFFTLRGESAVARTVQGSVVVARSYEEDSASVLEAQGGRHVESVRCSRMSVLRFDGGPVTPADLASWEGLEVYHTPATVDDLNRNLAGQLRVVPATPIPVPALPLTRGAVSGGATRLSVLQRGTVIEVLQAVRVAPSDEYDELPTVSVQSPPRAERVEEDGVAVTVYVSYGCTFTLRGRSVAARSLQGGLRVATAEDIGEILPVLAIEGAGVSEASCAKTMAWNDDESPVTLRQILEGDTHLDYQDASVAEFNQAARGILRILPRR